MFKYLWKNRFNWFGISAVFMADGDGGGGGGVTDTSGITEGDGHWMHDHPTLMSDVGKKNAFAKYPTMNAALDGGYEATKLVGRPHINIPADDADDTVKAEFKAKIAEHSGAVTKVEDFKVTRPEGHNKDNYNYAQEKAYLEMAVSQGYSQSQMETGLKMHTDVVAAIHAKDDAADKAEQAAGKVQLVSDWGGEANYKVNMELNTRCLESFFDADTAKLIEDKGMGNHPGFIKGVLALAQMAVKEGRTMKASAQTQQKAGTGTLRYAKMEERQKQNA